VAEQQRPNRPVLVCVGNLTLDEAVSPEGVHTISAGGDAIYAGLAARLSDVVDVQVLAPAGSDAPTELRQALELVGTDLATLPLRAEPTVRNVVTYLADGSRRWTLVTGEEHFEVMSVQPSDVSEQVLTADGILLSAMGLHAQLQLADWLRPRTRAVVYFDPQEDYIAGNEAALVDAVRRCDVFLPSEVEAVDLAGTADLAAAATAFLELGPQVVVIKRAEQGCLVATAGGQQLVAAQQVPAVDHTGAGDAFCGAFAAAHLAGADPVTAAERASAIAALAVSGHGLDGLVGALRARDDRAAVR
jgi:sugar/nucleoside kinase (ribokinase family)